MPSNATDKQFFSLSAKKCRYKLRAYSGYFCGLILAQLLASVLMLEGSNTMGFGDPFSNISLHIYSARLIMQFSVIWALVVAFAVSSEASKNASFTFPGNRLTDCFSDAGYLLACCAFGAVTTALYGGAFRLVVFLLAPGQVLAPGFYPAFSDLCGIAAVTFFNMVLITALGYFSGTLIRISRAFIVIVAAIGAFLFFSVSGSASFAGPIRSFLLDDQPLARVAVISLVVSALFYVMSVLIARRLEVK